MYDTGSLDAERVCDDFAHGRLEIWANNVKDLVDAIRALDRDAQFYWDFVYVGKLYSRRCTMFYQVAG